VYGTQEAVVDEQCSIDELAPQSPYAQSKLDAERYLHHLGKETALRYVICRLGTIFGISPGMRFHTAVNKFCWQAAMGQPITVWRTAYQQKRPYLDLEDAIRALGFILAEDLFDGNIYNVLTLNSTVADIVDRIKMRIDTLEIEFVDTKIMNQLSYDVSNERFCKTGFEFKGDLAKGIGETLDLLIAANSRG
jgi:UDP-glucose 4-epimerase